MLCATATSTQALFSTSLLQELNAHTQWRCFIPVLSLIKRIAAESFTKMKIMFVGYLCATTVG